MENRYGKLASWVYHIDKPTGRSFGDIEYYLRRLGKGIDGPILEPAVGTGRFFIPLLEAGLPMEGFDASPEMLEYCRGECERRGLRAPLWLQSFEEFSSPARYAAIVLPAGSFHLVTNADGAKQLLQRFVDALLPGGLLMLDLLPPDGFPGPTENTRSWQVGEGELLRLREECISVDHRSQTTLSHLHYEHWKNGKLLKSELEPFRMRWWGLEEFTLALQSVGFADICLNGNYRPGSGVQKGDEVITVEAVKR